MTPFRRMKNVQQFIDSQMETADDATKAVLEVIKNLTTGKYIVKKVTVTRLEEVDMYGRSKPVELKKTQTLTPPQP